MYIFFFESKSRSVHGRLVKRLPYVPIQASRGAAELEGGVSLGLASWGSKVQRSRRILAQGDTASHIGARGSTRKDNRRKEECKRREDRRCGVARRSLEEKDPDCIVLFGGEAELLGGARELRNRGRPALVPARQWLETDLSRSIATEARMILNTRRSPLRPSFRAGFIFGRYAGARRP